MKTLTPHSKHTVTIYEDERGLTHFTVKETGAMVAVNTKEQPAVNITEDGLLECKYHPYKTRKNTPLENRQKKYLVTKKGHPDNKYCIYPVDESKKPKALYYGEPCYIINRSNILVANPETGRIEFAKNT